MIAFGHGATFRNEDGYILALLPDVAPWTYSPSVRVVSMLCAGGKKLSIQNKLKVILLSWVEGLLPLLLAILLFSPILEQFKS